MNRAGLKTRDIKYKSNKNDRVMVVHTEDARSYAKYLEERDEIVSYDVCVPLDSGALDRVDKVDIRGDYFRQQWESDFQLIYEDGTYGIREVIKPDDMEKLAEMPEHMRSFSSMQLRGGGLNRIRHIIRSIWPSRSAPLRLVLSRWMPFYAYE